MATRPDLYLPQPARFYDRVRSAWGALRGDSPQARPLSDDLAPVVSPTPEEDGAAPATGVYSRSPGFQIDPRWISQLALNTDNVLQREGGHDLALYDALLDDPVAASSFQQRRLAVISRPWEVDAGDDSPQAAQAAEHLREQLNAVGWDSICDKMLYGRWYGYAVGEAMYERGPDGKYWLADILVPDRRSFAFTNAGELRLKTTENPGGEALPANKFWAFRCGASHDFTPYGVGLAHWCYWPIWFKKNILKFWSVYLEKFGMPTVLAKFPPGATDEDIARLLSAATAVASDRAVTVPESMDVSLLAEGRSSGDSYEQFVSRMDDELFRIILSQTGTSKSEAQGLGGSQSEVMQDVRNEVVRSDSDLLHESFNRTIARWLTDWNFGPNVAAPRVYRNLEDQEDLTALAERDTVLKAMGWKRTEESFREVYGEGYEPTETDEERLAREAQMAGGASPRGIDGERGGNVVDMEEERARLASRTFSADDLDAIDRWAVELADGTDPLLVEFASSIRGRVKGVTDADQLRIVLLEALERFPVERLGELAAVPFVAVRAAAEAGNEG